MGSTCDFNVGANFQGMQPAPLPPLGGAVSRVSLAYTCAVAAPFALGRPSPPRRVCVRRNGLCSTGARRYFPRTGHTLRGAFLRFWQAHNGSVMRGQPIAETGQEVNGDGSGMLYTVQWFENGRLEWHPEQSDPRYQVQLGRVGAEYLHRLGLT